VPWGGHGDQAKLADPYLVAVGGRPVRELVAALGWDDEFRAGGLAELVGTGHVVVVDVGLQDRSDPRAVGLGGPQETPGIPLRVDHGGLTPGRHEVAVVPQTRCHEDRDAVHANLPRGDIHRATDSITIY